MEISLPLDSDGFLRRECPHCEQEFKWHDGPANDQAEQQPHSDTFYCPICGEPAGPDSWWTQTQLDLIDNATERHVGQELGDMFKGLERSTRSNKFVKFKADRVNMPDPADPLVEPDDMTIVTSPCHAWEPVKISEGHVNAVHCIVCGVAFAV
ncbi:MAG: hypothetical protein ACR2FE_06245 [Aeromicrobium sp.]